MILLPDEAITEVELKSAGATVGSKHSKKGFGRFIRLLGPGIVTGAADDDPSGIATYSQAGAQFGLQLSWTMLFTLPLMTAVQEACMRIGAVTGKGLAAVIRDHYPRYVLYPVILLVVFANTLNIGSDLGAMAASLRLLVPVPFPVAALGFAILVLLLEVLVSYRSYVRLLKWLSLALFAYIGTAFLVKVPWADVLHSTFVPSFRFSQDSIYIVVAILGTTISPYLFFWQSSEVVEDEIAAHRLAQRGGVPRITKPYLRRLRIDTVIGMVFSNVVAWFILIVGAVVLGAGGVTNISSAADAARSLQPLVHGWPNAGYFAKLVFSIGIIGIGLLSVPVLAGSSSYAISETFNWREGLFRKFKQAREFYFVIIIGTFAGLIFDFVGLNPIKALIFAAVFNGLASVPLIALIGHISSNKSIMGEYKSRWLSRFWVWLTFGVMLVAAVALLKSLM
jgi:NRAMP (natural resistance-associated macrophage protein)-like metal ion transporter